MAYSEQPMIQTLQTGKYRECEQLLKDGSDPNQLGCDGVSPMHLAAGLGMRAVCLLLQHGGDPNIRSTDDTGTTPVHIAAMWGEPDCLQILLANGGDPFLEDQDGSNALDLARRYKHPEIIQVLERYMALLKVPTEETITPKYTYIRRSTGSSASVRSESPDMSDTTLDMSAYNTQKLHEYLEEFTKRRRSSMFQRNVQTQMNRYFNDGQKTHMVDVTSPDHPYIQPKYGSDAVQFNGNSPELNSPIPGYSPFQHGQLSPVEESLHLYLSVSDEEQSASCDSFVTCDGEDLDTVLQKSVLNKSFEEDDDSDENTKRTFDTVIKNRTFVNNSASDSNIIIDMNQSNRNMLSKKPVQRRRDKYCKRVPLFQPLETQDLLTVQCDLCGRNVEVEYCIQTSDEVVCKNCNKLSQELDDLLEDRSSQVKTVRTVPKEKKNNKEQTQNHRMLNKFSKKKKESYITGQENNEAVSDKTTFENKNSNHGNQQNVEELVCKFRQSNLHNIPYSTKYEDWKNDSLISSDESFLGPGDKVAKSEFHPSDFSTVTIDDGDLDSVKNEAFLGFSNNKETSRLTDIKANGAEKNKINPVSKIDYETDKTVLNNTFTVQGIKDGPTKKTSPEYVDLWDEVRAKTSKCRNVLDRGFIGRESFSSFQSDATIEYVYTDPENGIALIERHIPSLCGSIGSRRSLDSQQSFNSRCSSGHNSGASEDTEIYDWREEAMCEGFGGAGDAVPKTKEIRPELKKLNNETIRSRLCTLGDYPGPVTNSTRQTYLKRLSQLEKDPDAKLITKKSPEYPAELRCALQGNLDLTNMASEEDKMFAAFQNPNRHQRWREGTLKSSFNYILLDPRVTKNLPNRACNMNDLDVLQCFISAIFYVGKGKRARPYCHLYEAIKQMKKPKDKVSSKVLQILEIWSSGLGVVSLHCFQSVIPVEAYTREACMVDAIGLNKLTNMKRGDYYGISVTYSMKQRKKMGVYLLTKALQIFLAEGERQISPLDIKTDCI